MEDCSLNTFIYQVTLPQTESPPEFETFVKIIFTCNGVTYESPFFSDIESILEWAQNELGDFGTWSLTGNTLTVTETLCDNGSLTYLAGETIVLGCTIEDALNFDEDANVNNSSCTFPPNASPNYVDIICDTFTKTSVEYYPGLFFDMYVETCNVNINRPVFIGFHPGGKVYTDYKTYPQDFGSRGYIGITADYGHRTPFTGKVQKECAIYIWYLTRFIRANAAIFGANPNNIFWGGSSAGAVMALQAMLASLDINNAIFLSASNSALNLVNAGFSSQPSGIFTQSGAASSIFTPFIGASNKTCQFKNGTLDCTVPYSFASCLVDGALENYNAMVAAGNTSTFHPYIGSGHELSGFHDEILLGGGNLITGVPDTGVVQAFKNLLVP